MLISCLSPAFAPSCPVPCVVRVLHRRIPQWASILFVRGVLYLIVRECISPERFLSSYQVRWLYSLLNCKCRRAYSPVRLPFNTSRTLPGVRTPAWRGLRNGAKNSISANNFDCCILISLSLNCSSSEYIEFLKPRILILIQVRCYYEMNVVTITNPEYY